MFHSFERNQKPLKTDYNIGIPYNYGNIVSKMTAFRLLMVEGKSKAIRRSRSSMDIMGF